MLHSLFPNIFPVVDSAPLLALIMITIAVGFMLQKFKFFKNAGIVFTVVLLGIVMTNIGITPTSADVYSPIFTYCTPICICLMLLNVDLRQVLKLSKAPLLAIASACISVTIVSFALGLIFCPMIDEGWKLSGMFVGTYTGGSPNLTAIGVALDASPEALAAANAADYVGCMPALVILFALPAILKKSVWFNKVWPYSLSDEELAQGEDRQIAGELRWSIVEIAKLLAIALSVFFVARTIAGFAPSSISSAVRVLLITTMSLIIGQIPAVRKLRGAMDLGMLMSLMFLTVIGFQVNIADFFNSALLTAVYVILVLVGTTLLHFIFCRLMKVPYQYVLTSVMAGIWDGPSAAMLAISAGWKCIVPVSMIMGTLGAACGNYLGIMCSLAMRAIIGG